MRNHFCKSDPAERRRVECAYTVQAGTPCPERLVTLASTQLRRFVCQHGPGAMEKATDTMQYWMSRPSDQAAQLRFEQSLPSSTGRLADTMLCGHLQRCTQTLHASASGMDQLSCRL